MEPATKTAGAIKGGNGRYVFDLHRLGGIDAGTGYSTADGTGGVRMATTVKQHRMYIGGEWGDSASGETLDASSVTSA